MMPRFVTSFWAVLILLSCSLAQAQWQEDGLPFPMGGSHLARQLVSDGEGGFICIFHKDPLAKGDINAQRVDGLGNLLWGSSGVPICTVEPGEKDGLRIASDGNGGAYICWRDYRTSTGVTTIFAQHVDGSGQTSWQTDGVALVTGVGFTTGWPVMYETSDGGVLVAWVIDLATNQLRVQKLSSQGYEWDYGGVTVYDTNLDIGGLKCVELSDGSVFVVFKPYDASYDGDIYATGLSAEGAMEWGPHVVMNGVATSAQLTSVVPDPYGGCYLAGARWGNGSDVWVSRVQNDGDPEAIDGVEVSNANNSELNICMCPADEGVWIAWFDQRDFPEDAIYVQKVSRNLEMLLPANGLLVVREVGEKNLSQIVPDMEGGALLCWQDQRWGPGDVFVQKISPSGYNRWSSDGICLRERESSSIPGGLIDDGLGGLCAVWSEYENGSYVPYAQRIERNGFWGYPSGEISAVQDVPDDQGGSVLLSWDASRLDAWPANEVAFYSLWRALPEGQANRVTPLVDWYDRLGVLADQQPIVRADAMVSNGPYWLLLESVPAYQLPGYSHVVPTLADSTADDPADQLFQVIAHSGSAGQYWISQSAIGRSVDNLPPGMPINLAGNVSYVNLGMTLYWQPNADGDVLGYEIHRGTTPEFDPDVQNLISAVGDTTYFDDGWSPDMSLYYKVAAMDVHGNRSGYAFLPPGAVTDVPASGDMIAWTHLYANHPNPFNPQTTIAFELPNRETVTLRIFDMAGRLVRGLITSETKSHGRHEVVWNGRDDTGRQVASGTYFYRLEAGSYSDTKRMVLIK